MTIVLWLVSTWLPAAWQAAGPILCPFRRLTGLPCPGCGLTRSFSFLSHGHLSEAFASHPFGPLLAGVVVVLFIVRIVEVVLHVEAPLEPLAKALRPVAWSVAVVWLGWAIWRLVEHATQG